jgi:hypothetical protein
MDATGTKLVRWRTFKMCEPHAKRATASGGGPHADAEKTLFAVRGCPGVRPDDAGPAADRARRRFAFAREHETHLARRRSAGRVAVLRSEPTLCYNSGRAYQSVCTMEQLLIQRMVPFKIVDDAQLDAGVDADLLVLPDVQLLWRHQWDSIKEFVRHGGRVLSTESTGACDGWYRRYARPLVDELLDPGVSSSGTRRGSLGTGRIVHVPVVDYPRPYPGSPHDWSVTPEYWQLPRNWRLILDEIETLLGADMRFRARYHPTVVMDLFEEDEPTPGWQAVHVQDLADAPPTTAAFDWRPPKGRSFARGSLWQPGGDSELTPHRRDDWMTFEVRLEDAMGIVRLEIA